MKNFRNQLNGLSLLELILVLTIVGVLLLTATRFYTASSEARKLADAYDQLGIIQNAGNRWLLTHPDFVTDLTSLDSFKDFVDRNYLPSSYDNSTKAVKNSWGGNLTVKFSSSGMLITLEDVSKTSAEKLQLQYKKILCQTTNTNPNINCPKNPDGTISSTCNIALNFVPTCNYSSSK
jgi:prepilin-type N-terminal cleavage/methylation domain-containing protein